MSAGNAFAAAGNGALVDGDDQDDLLRPPKRKRISDVSTPAIWTPSADPETSLEVDIMILDFLAFQATMACLESRKPHENALNRAPVSLRRNLELVDSFTSIFKARHRQYQHDPELRLRLLLLKMATLFSQRFTSNPTTPDRSSLQALRTANRLRAQAWIGSDYERAPTAICEISLFAGTDPIALNRLERNRAHVLHQLGLPAEDEDYEDAFYGTASCVSMLDVLPLFVELSAASSNIHGSSLTDRWMQLACEFMLQACLEQYLVCGARGTNVLDEAFAWGYTEGDYNRQDPAEARRQSEINDMFEDDNYAAEIDGWSALKQEYVQELAEFGAPGKASKSTHAEADIAVRLETVAAKHPIDTFEASILKFLEALAMSIAEPVLVQLERGQMDGMTKDETRDFLTQCGVHPSQC